jgi:uncharacterized protein YdeI (YjbR/CyaY-like superfamily)
MAVKNTIQTRNEFYAKDRKAWRKWLQQNHVKEESVWLVIYHKKSNTPSVYYDEAVEEALCFGWIDSKPNKRDHESFYQFFAKRKPKSNWSALNKQRVEQLMQQKQMTPAGLAMVELAKQTGTWNALDKISALEYPIALQEAFDKNKIAQKNFEAFPPSTRKGILEWIINAKTAATQAKRIEDTVTKAAQNIRANQYVKKT